MSDHLEPDNLKPTPSRVKVLTPRTIVLGSLLLILVAAGTVWLLLAMSVGKDQLDVIRTAGTLVVGAGGAVALLLAARRQRSTELELQQKYEAAEDAKTDATERRITELYIKAADQLGSEKAPVRLAGLYALERLAQNTPYMRQTIVNVICAYLRMPYSPPLANTARPLGRRRKPHASSRITSGMSRSVVASSPDATDIAWQEHEVRLAAQKILADHLRVGPDPEHPVETFWKDIDLDLTKATLVSFDLNRCRLRHSSFKGTTFARDAYFKEATFRNASFKGATLRDATFAGATFGDAHFDQATFTGDACFKGAEFIKDVSFKKATFEHANFEETTFTGNAHFKWATVGNAYFKEAKFAREAHFNWATFAEGGLFNKVTFAEDASFDGATFSHAWFVGTTFARDAWFTEVTFTKDVLADKATFTGAAHFDRATFAEGAWCRGVTFAGDACFKEATFTRDAHFEETTFAGNVLADKATFIRGVPPGIARFMDGADPGASDEDS